MSNEHETEWQEVDQAAQDKQFEEYTKRQNRRFAEKPPQGRSVWRILPPRKDRPASYCKETFVHYVKDSSGTIIAVGECPIKTGKGAVCVPCQEASRLRRWAAEPGLTKEETDKRMKVAKDMAAQWSCYVSAVRLDVEDPMKAEPVVLQIGHSIFQSLEAMRHETEGMGGDFTHPDKGFNIVITRKGTTQFDTEYSAVAAAKVTPVMNRAWLKKLPDLEEVAGQFQNEVVAAAFAGKTAQGAVAGSPPPAAALGPVPEQTPQGEWKHPGKAQ